MTDFEEVGAPLAPTVTATDVPPAATAEEYREVIRSPSEGIARPYDPEPARERIRSWLASVLVGGVLLLIFALASAVLFFRVELALAEKLSAILLPPLIGLAGAVTGFYFAARR